MATDMTNPFRPRWQVVYMDVRSGRVVADGDTFYRLGRATRECNTVNGWLWRGKELTVMRAIVQDRHPHRNLPRL